MYEMSFYYNILNDLYISYMLNIYEVWNILHITMLEKYYSRLVFEYYVKDFTEFSSLLL